MSGTYVAYAGTEAGHARSRSCSCSRSLLLSLCCLLRVFGGDADGLNAEEHEVRLLHEELGGHVPRQRPEPCTPIPTPPRVRLEDY
eukprot:3628962-Rhodomonas_salina.1